MFAALYSKGINMRHSLILAALLSASMLYAVETAQEIEVQNLGQSVEVLDTVDAVDMNADAQNVSEPVLTPEQNMIISVTGQGVAPINTQSPAQAYALAKRAAIADGYRLIAEKVKGVRVDGQDVIKNMMVKRSTVRTAVHAMVQNANVVETMFKDGLCEVEMEISLSHSDFTQQ
jgi:hypothetical protein